MMFQAVAYANSAAGLSSISCAWRSAPRYRFPGQSRPLGCCPELGFPRSACARKGQRESAVMTDVNRSYRPSPGAVSDRAVVDAGLRAHMIRVYNYMAVGVALTGVIAWLTSQIVGPALLNSPLIWVFMLAPLALVFFISFRINTLSAGAARALFFVYAALVG